MKYCTPNEYTSTYERTAPTPWERNPKVTLMYLLSSLRRVIRQLSPFAHSLLVHSLSLQTVLSMDLHLHYSDQVYTITLEMPQV